MEIYILVINYVIVNYALSNLYSIKIYHNIIFVSSKYNFLYQEILTLKWNKGKENATS